MSDEKGSPFTNDSDRAEALNRFRTAATVNMTPELFEKLYLTPKTSVRGHLRETFGNPTPVGLIGFLLALTPLSCDLMGWRGAGGGGAASIAIYFFQGGLLLILAGILEWILGNTFPSVVFFSFGGFWLSYGGTLTPSFAASASYAPANATSPSEGAATTGFNASLAFWFMFMAILCVIFLICSLRTNIAFFIIFLGLILAFSLIAGAYWKLAEDFAGNAAIANRLLVAAGACAFVTAMAGWWILTAILLDVVDFPLQLPVGDLSTVVKGRSAMQ